MRIVWFRRDLRLSDNEALASAVGGGSPVVAVYAHEAAWPVGEAARAWLSRSLSALDRSLRERGNSLVHRTGGPVAALGDLVAETGAREVHCTRDWTPAGLEEERRVAEVVAAAGATLRVSEGQYLAEPGRVVTVAGEPFSVFSPFHRAWSSAWRPETPLPAPAHIPAPTRPIRSDAEPEAPAGPPDLEAVWAPGESGARSRLAAFLADALGRYDADRDVPGIHGTSELSPHLTFGEISPRQVAAAVLEHDEASSAPFLRQLAWREFAGHVLHAHPETLTRPLRAEFADFPWRDDPEAFAAWQDGCTGYPLVDAGMRQLGRTGWMHNRTRLVCGSFLTKDLLIPWQQGEAYFREALVDHDPASNVFNWQWVAGCGADAAPYFRIFNPALQAARFDPEGLYVRTWAADATVDGYPAPIVDHAAARGRALAAFASIKRR